MKETLLTVLENTRLAEGIYRLRLTGTPLPSLRRGSL